MEKYIIILILYIINFSSFSQRIEILDEINEPIYNVSLYTSDFNKSAFTNFKGEVEISIFNENDSIYIQHPSFQNIILVKREINERIILKSDIIEIDEVIISVNRWEESLNEVTNKSLIINRNLVNTEDLPDVPDDKMWLGEDSCFRFDLPNNEMSYFISDVSAVPQNDLYYHHLSYQQLHIYLSSHLAKIL